MTISRHSLVIWWWGLLDLVNSFSCLEQGDHVVYVNESIYVVDYNYCFMCIKPAIHIEDEANLTVIDDPFYVFLDIVTNVTGYKIHA